MRCQLLLFFAITVTSVYCQRASFTPLGAVGKPPPTILRKGTRPVRPAPPAARPVKYKAFVPVAPPAAPAAPPAAPAVPVAPPAVPAAPPAAPPAVPVVPPAAPAAPPAAPQAAPVFPPAAPVAPPAAPVAPPAAVPPTRTVTRLGVKRTFAPPRAAPPGGAPPAPVPAAPAPLRRGPPPAAFRARQAMPRTKTKSVGFIGKPMPFAQSYFVPTTYPPVPTTFYVPYRYDRPEVKKEEEES